MSILNQLNHLPDDPAQYLKEVVGNLMGRLGNYPFFMGKNDFKKVTQTLNAEFGKYKPIKGQTVLSDSGGYDRKLTLNGILVAQSVHALKPLEWYLMKREPLRYTTLFTDMEVVITSMTENKEHFETHGLFRVQSYNITLEEVYGGSDEGSISSLLKGVFK
ncbi:MAG: phage tail protein [Sulfurospirillum sp.]|nr:phage tail protein [Sulfurospirillum sp.]